MLNLEPIKARLAAATPGPWEMMPSKNKGGLDRFVGPPGCGFPVCEMFVINEKWGADMCLIANAPADLAALVTEVERLRARLEQLEAMEALERAIWRKCILDDEDLEDDLKSLHDRVNGLHKEATKNLDWMPGKPIDWSRYNAES
jgi:hypothetical protein